MPSNPHDIRDEGAERAVETILRRTGIDTLIAEAVTIEERHKYLPEFRAVTASLTWLY